MSNITQSAQPQKPKQEGFKWGQELLKAKAIIASLNTTIEEQHEMIDELNDDNDDLRNQLHRTLTLLSGTNHSQNVFGFLVAFCWLGHWCRCR